MKNKRLIIINFLIMFLLKNNFNFIIIYKLLKDLKSQIFIHNDFKESLDVNDFKESLMLEKSNNKTIGVNNYFKEPLDVNDVNKESLDVNDFKEPLIAKKPIDVNDVNKETLDANDFKEPLIKNQLTYYKTIFIDDGIVMSCDNKIINVYINSNFFKKLLEGTDNKVNPLKEFFHTFKKAKYKIFLINDFIDIEKTYIYQTLKDFMNKNSINNVDNFYKAIGFSKDPINPLWEFK